MPKSQPTPTMVCMSYGLMNSPFLRQMNKLFPELACTAFEEGLSLVCLLKKLDCKAGGGKRVT